MSATAVPVPKPRPGLHCQAVTAQVIAATKGEKSAAALALREFNLRLAGGEPVIMFATRGRWLVGTEAQVQAQRTALEEMLALRACSGC